MDRLSRRFASEVSVSETSSETSGVLTTDELKPSFDRFGDDLTELLLSYLSVWDKINFECLSKRIQSLVFNKHNSLIISNNCVEINDNSTLNQLLIKSKEYKRLFVIDVKLLDKLLNKLHSIQTIIIDNYCIIDGQILRSIAENCPHLRQFICTSIKSRDISDEDLTYFGHKLSGSLTSIQFDCLQENRIKSLLKVMKNSIQTVNIENNNFCLRNDFVLIDLQESIRTLRSERSLKMLPKLSSIFITCYSTEDIKQLADYYSHSLQKIRIKLVSNNLMGNAMNACLKQLSRFVNIRFLTLLLYTHHKGYVAPIDDGLRLIGHNCPKLKHFVCEMTRNLVSGQMFSILSEYSALKTCKISTTDENLENYGTVERLSNLKNLKHLTLYLEYLSDKHFVNIHSFLPNLKSFKVNTSIGYLSDSTVQSLSKLAQLTTIEISGSSPSLVNISDTSVSSLVASCPAIRTLCLFCKTSVGKQTVDQFISTAKQFPKNNYKYFYEINDFDDNSQQIIAELVLPQNLSIYPI